jgi:hypothetical protein
MKYYLKTSCLFSLLFALVSCAAVQIFYPTNETITAAKFQKPTNEQALGQIMSSIYENYKDPDSVMFRDFQVEEFGAINLESGYPTFGYRVWFFMNAKNGGGAYNGYKYYSYLVTKSRAIEMTGHRLSTASYQFVPERYFYFYSESELRTNAPPSLKPAGS